MQFLRFADQILSLNSTGQQCELGSFEELRSSGGYVEGLFQSGKIDLTVTLPLPDLSIEHSGPRREVPREKKVKLDINTSQDKSRQLGDWSTYRFYASSLGWWTGIVFTVLQFGYGFLMVFPSE